jgi:hypothetical protein
MRTFIGLVVVIAVMAQLSTAKAATEVARFPANNSFLVANSNEPDGTSRSVGVTRELTQRGGPVYRVFYLVSNFETGLFMSGSGLIDAQDFQMTPHSASLDIDINTITLDMQVGDLPEDGQISVHWAGTDVQRISGGSVNVSDNIRFLFVGTSVDVTADITGSMFGTPLFEPFGDIRILSSAIIVITR